MFATRLHLRPLVFKNAFSPMQCPMYVAEEVGWETFMASHDIATQSIHTRIV